MSAFVHDVRAAARRLAATPGFTLFAVVSLAVGIGVTTAVYSAVREFFWAPLGVTEPAALLTVAEAGVAGRISWPDFEDVEAQPGIFTAVAATTPFSAAVVAAEDPEILHGEAVSQQYFAVVRATPRLGRLLQPADDRAGTKVIVLSEQFWRSRLHGDPTVIGRVAKVAGDGYEIVGVVRGSFHGLQPFLPSAFWIPAHGLPAREMAVPWLRALASRSTPTFAVWGRLASGVSAGRADQELSALAARLDDAYPRTPARPRRWTTKPLLAVMSNEGVDTFAALMVTAVVTILVIACTNLANLTLARSSARAQEIAIRAALGAARWRLVREQALESLLVAAAGAVLGVPLLYRLLDLFSTDLPMGVGTTMRFRPELNTAALATASAAVCLAVLVAGLWPAWQSTREDVRAQIGAGFNATSTKWRIHRTLVAWQVTGSVALFLVSALCVTIIGRVRQGSDFEVTRNAVTEIDFSRNGRSEPEMRRLVAAIEQDLAGHGLPATAASDAYPIGFLLFPDAGRVTGTDRPFGGARDGIGAAVIGASPGFAAVGGVRLLRGRWFDAQDDARTRRVAVLTASLARTLFQSIDVVGREVAFHGGTRSDEGAVVQSMAIVGVAADPEDVLARRPQAIIFLPFAQRESRGEVLLTVRGPTAGAALLGLRAAIRRVNPEIAIGVAGPASIVLAGPLYTLRLVADVASALGALALVLAMAGLYGVLAHVVARRTRELGIRVAVGARPRQIFGLVLRDGGRPVVKGLVLGMMIGIGARMAILARFYTTVSLVDPWLLAVLPIPFGVAAIAACTLPAMRAARIDPNVVLREL